MWDPAGEGSSRPARAECSCPAPICIHFAIDVRWRVGKGCSSIIAPHFVQPISMLSKVQRQGFKELVNATPSCQEISNSSIIADSRMPAYTAIFHGSSLQRCNHQCPTPEIPLIPAQTTSVSNDGTSPRTSRLVRNEGHVHVLPDDRQDLSLGLVWTGGRSLAWNTRGPLPSEQYI